MILFFKPATRKQEAIGVPVEFRLETPTILKCHVQSVVEVELALSPDYSHKPMSASTT